MRPDLEKAQIQMAIAAAVSMAASASASGVSSFSHPPKPTCAAALPVRSRQLKVRAEVERQCLSRRDISLSAGGLLVLLTGSGNARAGTLEEDYAKETREVIDQVRGALEMEKSDPNISTAVAALRETSNSWVAKYRREKQLAGKPSFSNMYSVLNAISGHYISFGPTAPIPAKRKARILEEVETAEKALTKGR